MSKTKMAVPVEVYSRVVGYFRPVNQWNLGKKEEFSERKEYHVDPVSDIPFIEGFSSERNSVCEY